MAWTRRLFSYSEFVSTTIIITADFGIIQVSSLTHTLHKWLVVIFPNTVQVPLPNTVPRTITRVVLIAKTSNW